MTKFPPIKVAQRKYYKGPEVTVAGGTATSELAAAATWYGSAEQFTQRQFCLNRFVEEFGYMPLQRAAMRFDPLFFKDPVSILRKKYRQIETVS